MHFEFLFQLRSVAQSCPTLCNPRDCSTPDFPVHHHLPELAQTYVCQVGDAIQPSHPLLSPSPPAFNPSQPQGLFPMSQFFASSGQRIGASASVSILAVKYSGLISFRMDWLDLLAIQGTLKSLLQYQSPKAFILRHPTFFMVQLSHPYMTTLKTKALTRRIFVGKVMFWLFNMLFRWVIAFLPRSKHLLISWLQSPSAVILEPKKMKSLTVSIVSPSICHEVMGLDAMIFIF